MTILILAAALIALLAVQQVFTRPLVMWGFEKSEREYMVQKSRAVQHLLKAEVRGFHDRFGDWSNWDDLYGFVESKDPAFVDSNLNIESLDVLGVSAVAIINARGEVVFSVGHEPGDTDSRPFPASMLVHIAPESPLLATEPDEHSGAGVIATPEGLFIVSARPILTSERQGPVRGTLFMARRLNAQRMKAFSRFIGAHVEVMPATSVEESRLPEVSPDDPVRLEWRSGEEGVASWRVRDIDGEPSIIMQVRARRIIHEHARQTALQIAFWTAIAGLCVTATVLVVLERLVLRRVEVLTREVAACEGADARVTVRGNDEIARLASSINQTLDALGRSRREAEESSRAKSDFLANMSHEIRTPMTAILGYADALAEEHSNLDRDTCVRTIRRNGEHLLSIINDILDLSKIEAGEMEVQLAPMSPVSVLEEVASLMQVRAQDKGIELGLDYKPPLPTLISSDALRLRQVLLNLVSNAVKFTDKGSVRVGLSAEEAGERARVTITVTDTGIGMSPEQMSRLFKPFSQADSSVTRRFGGTGLGLTISRRLMRMLGGDIEVRSVEGGGSVFTVRFEAEAVGGFVFSTHLLERATAGAELMSITDNEELQGRVLIAEDGPDNQRLFRFHLSKLGIESEIVENGKLAVERVLAATSEPQPIDLVLMDMQMPVQDGYSATRELRAAGWKGPIIALTAHAMSGDRERCLQAGCDDYLTKPVDRAKLARMLQRYLDQKPLRDAA